MTKPSFCEPGIGIGVIIRANASNTEANGFNSPLRTIISCDCFAECLANAIVAVWSDWVLDRNKVWLVLQMQMQIWLESFVCTGNVVRTGKHYSLHIAKSGRFVNVSGSNNIGF